MRSVMIKTEHFAGGMVVASCLFGGRQQSKTFLSFEGGGRDSHKLAAVRFVQESHWCDRVRFVQHGSYFAPGNLHYHTARIDMPPSDGVLAGQDLAEFFS